MPATLPRPVAAPSVESEHKMPSTITRPAPTTPAQRETYYAIAVHMKTHGGLAPTVQELADGEGVSKPTIQERLDALEAKGWLMRDKHKARSIRLLMGVCPCCGQKLA